MCKPDPVPKKILRQLCKTLEDRILYLPGPEDLEASRLEHRRQMLRFFDAPSVIIIYADDDGSDQQISTTPRTIGEFSRVAWPVS